MNDFIDEIARKHAPRIRDAHELHYAGIIAEACREAVKMARKLDRDAKRTEDRSMAEGWDTGALRP